jgi:hypothetical protein
MVVPVNDETDFYFQAILVSLASALFSLFIWFVKSFVWLFFAKCLYFVFYYLALLTSVWICLYWFFSQLELKSGGHRRFALSFVFLFFSIYINGSLYERWFCNKTPLVDLVATENPNLLLPKSDLHKKQRVEFVTPENSTLLVPKSDLHKNEKVNLNVDSNFNKSDALTLIKNFLSSDESKAKDLIYQNNLAMYRSKNLLSSNPRSQISYKNISINQLVNYKKNVVIVDFTLTYTNNKEESVRWYLRKSNQIWQIDMPSSLGLNETPIRILKTNGETISKDIIPIMRVEAKLDDFFLGKFISHKTTHFCLCLIDNNRDIMYGYVGRDSDIGKELFEFLKDGSSHQITLSLQPVVEDIYNQANIVGLVDKSFFVE